MIVPVTTSSCTCRAQLTIPSEFVQMPWSACESLDVQFGSIDFLDDTEDDLVTPDKTLAAKTDSATSTTPNSSVETEISIPGIHQEVQSTPTGVQQQSASQSMASYPSKTTASASQTLSSSLHLAQSGSSLVQQSAGLTQPAPPPNTDNIRNGGYLITNHHSLPEATTSQIIAKTAFPDLSAIGINTTRAIYIGATWRKSYV